MMVKDFGWLRFPNGSCENWGRGIDLVKNVKPPKRSLFVTGESPKVITVIFLINDWGCLVFSMLDADWKRKMFGTRLMAPGPCMAPFGRKIQASIYILENLTSRVSWVLKLYNHGTMWINVWSLWIDVLFFLNNSFNLNVSMPFFLGGKLVSIYKFMLVLR